MYVARFMRTVFLAGETVHMKPQAFYTSAPVARSGRDVELKVLRLQQGVFFGLVALALLPPVGAAMALLAGLVFALLWSNPFLAKSMQWQTWLLQASVVGLGAGMNLSMVAKTGLAGFGQTLLTLSVTLLLLLVLTRVFNTERTVSLLIGVGTAICGGSAIAAIAPAIGAKNHQSSVALAVVFLLNAVGLVLFPHIGHAVGLSQADFGLWSALAIHDMSSVVGATLDYGSKALEVGTTVKLARTLWIVPLTLVLARLWKRDPDAVTGPSKQPWFILGFLVAAALATWVPAFAPTGALVAQGARRLLVATLFLVGAGVSRETLGQVGVRPLLLGVVLWGLMATGTLLAIQATR